MNTVNTQSKFIAPNMCICLLFFSLRSQVNKCAICTDCNLPQVQFNEMSTFPNDCATSALLFDFSIGESVVEAIADL